MSICYEETQSWTPPLLSSLFSPRDVWAQRRGGMVMAMSPSAGQVLDCQIQKYLYR